MIDIEVLRNLILGGGLAGLAVTPVITFVKTVFNLENKRRLRFALAVVTSLLGGALTVSLVQTTFDSFTSWLVATGTLFTASTIFYNAYWKDSTPERVTEALTDRITGS